MRRRVLKIKISATPKAGVADIFYGYKVCSIKYDKANE